MMTSRGGMGAGTREAQGGDICIHIANSLC